MSEDLTVQPLRRRRRRVDMPEGIEAIEAVTFPMLERLDDRGMLARIRDRREERQILSLVIASRVEAETAEGDDRGLFERIIDWLADPENRAKLEAIIEWFVKIMGTFGGVPV